jgi:hypothetical protein
MTAPKQNYRSLRIKTYIAIVTTFVSLEMLILFFSKNNIINDAAFHTWGTTLYIIAILAIVLFEMEIKKFSKKMMSKA